MTEISLIVTLNKQFNSNQLNEYAISQLRIVRSGLHLVTYLDVGNFCDKSTKQLYMEFVCKFFLDFPIQASKVNMYN